MPLNFAASAASTLSAEKYDLMRMPRITHMPVTCCTPIRSTVLHWPAACPLVGASSTTPQTNRLGRLAACTSRNASLPMHLAWHHALERKIQAAQASHRIEANGHHCDASRKFQHAVRTSGGSSHLTVLTVP